MLSKFLAWLFGGKCDDVAESPRLKKTDVCYTIPAGTSAIEIFESILTTAMNCPGERIVVTWNEDHSVCIRSYAEGSGK